MDMCAQRLFFPLNTGTHDNILYPTSDTVILGAGVCTYPEPNLMLNSVSQEHAAFLQRQIVVTQWVIKIMQWKKCP